MKTIRRTALGLLITLVSANAAFAKEWRGIVPLHSTRADVELLLGPPTKGTSYASYYSLPDEIAVISLQRELCDSDVGKLGIEWNVPVGTVISINVIPKAAYPKERFATESGFNVESANAGFMYYTNGTLGQSVETYDGTVTMLTYTPSERENFLRCSRIINCCVDIFTRFDEYEKLSFEDEKARLDNYAITLQEQWARGVIVVYGESRAERSKLMKRTGLAKRYLAEKHGIEPQRMLVVDGGYRERSTTELNVYPFGGYIGRIYLFPQSDPEERNKSRGQR
jgi:hypothetical protein